MGVRLVLGLGVCCVWHRRSGWVLRASFVDSVFVHARGLEGSVFVSSFGGRVGGGGLGSELRRQRDLSSRGLS